jgi:uncharacterized membrane protein YfcA
MPIDLMEILAANGVLALGSVLQAATGLGAGLVVVPLLALISLDFVPGPVILAALALAWLMAWQGRGAIHYAGMPVLLSGLLMGMILGASLLALLPLDRLGILFGGFILLAVAVSISGLRVVFASTTLTVAGVLSGFMGTTAAVGAPVLALLYQHHPGPVLRATLGFLYFISSIVMLALLHLAGRFSTHELLLGLVLVPGVVAGYLIAGYLSPYLDRGCSRIAVLAISTISAVLLILRSF